jgi:peptidoglycan/LPS O-acetylase OafA/YrhL
LGRTAAVGHFGVDVFGENEQIKLARAGVDFFFCLSKTLASYLLAGNVFS